MTYRWGIWVRKRLEDKKDWFVFQEAEPPHSEADELSTAEYGHKVHCRKFPKHCPPFLLRMRYDYDLYDYCDSAWLEFSEGARERIANAINE